MRLIFNRIKDDIKLCWKALLLVAVIMLVLQILFDNVCPMKILFGLPCPACGLTHSVLCIITFKWKKSLEYNPTGFLWFFAILNWAWFRYVLGKKSPVVMTLFVVSALASTVVYFFNLRCFL